MCRILTNAPLSVTPRGPTERGAGVVSTRRFALRRQGDHQALSQGFS